MNKQVYFDINVTYTENNEQINYLILNLGYGIERCIELSKYKLRVELNYVKTNLQILFNTICQIIDAREAGVNTECLQNFTTRHDVIGDAVINPLVYFEYMANTDSLTLLITDIDIKKPVEITLNSEELSLFISEFQSVFALTTLEEIFGVEDAGL